jgi:hypothetical protein
MKTEFKRAYLKKGEKMEKAKNNIIMMTFMREKGKII